MKKIIFLIMFIAMFSLVSAADCGDNSLGTFKINDVMELRQTCDDCTFVNISSITYPNSTTININEFMTKSGIEFSFTFSAVVVNGDYFYVVSGDKDGGFESETFCFDVTPTGTELKTSQSFLYVLLILGVFVVFIFCFIAAVKIPFKNNRDGEGELVSITYSKYLKLGAIMISYVLFVWLINSFLGLTENFIILSMYGGFFEIMFNVLNSISYPLFVAFIVFSFILMWKDLKLKKLIKRGLGNR